MTDDDTRVSLREFVQRIFDERQRALDLAMGNLERVLDEREKAVRLATSNLEHRLEGLNELRREVIQDRGQYITRVQYEADQREARTWRDRADGILSLANYLGIGVVIALLLEVARAFGVVK